MGLLSTPLGRLAGAAAVTAGGVAFLSRGASPSTTTSSGASCFAWLVAAAIFVGSNAWTTFFSGIIMFKHLPKTQFGDLQSKLFPAYFAIEALASSIMAALSATGRAGRGDGRRPLAVASAAALALSLLNLAVLEPLTTAAMYRRRAAEAGSGGSEEKRKANKRFGMLHGMSSLANLFALGSGLVALWYLAEGMA